MALGDLLARGYFPKELPSPFVTVPFANALSAASPLPADFAKSATRGNRLPTAKAGRYSLARGGLFRRPLSICNPLHYFLLSKELMQNWTTLAAPNIALPAGTHVLTLFIDSGAQGMGNFNFMTLTPTAGANTPFNGTPAPVPGTIQFV